MELLREYEVQVIIELNVTSQVTYSLRHTATDLLEVFSEQVDKEALQQLAESPFIAVLADETTDITTKKRMGINVKTSDKTLKVKTRFLTNAQLNSGSGQSIADAIEKEMNSRGISLERIIAPGSDGASVMTGPGKGATGLLRRKNPHLLNIHCIAHSLALCTSQEAEKIPAMQNYHEILTSLFYYFKASAS